MSLPIPAEEPDFGAFLALDWADREHAWALEVAGSRQRETGTIPHTPEAIESWAMQWAARFPGQLIAVALEQSRGALFYALSKYPHLVLFPIHPATSSDYRKAMFPSGSKDDPHDAELLLDLLTLHRDRLRRFQPDTEPTRKLQVLVEKRRQLVEERTAQTNRITDQLKQYFPQVLDWFDELSAPIVAAFLQRWPTLPQLQAEDPQRVREFFYQHGSRSKPRMEERLSQIAPAQVLVCDTAVVEPGVLLVRTWLEIVAVLKAGIHTLEKSIQQVASAHPDYFIFASFPAAGPTMAPRLLAAFGSQRERYSSANQVQSFSGIAPVMAASGRQRWIHFRWACPQFLRQSFHEYAELSRQRCGWARDFYQQQIAKGNSHAAAVRSLAFKWIRILFRCWQSRTTYQEDLYLAARKGRAVPLRPSPLPAAVPLRSNAPPPSANRSDFLLKSVGEILKSLAAEA